MNDRERLALQRAASNYVRHQPTRFAEAAAWVVSLKPKGGTATKSSRMTVDSVAYRTIAAVVLHYCDLLDEQASTPTKQDAYRIILTSWLLDEIAHLPYARPGSPFDRANLHECLQQLPVLDGHEFMNLTGRFAHAHDPRWHRLVLAAWKVVDDPGYMSTHGASGMPTGKAGSPTNTASPSGSMPVVVARARESYDWARQHASHLFTGTSKYPEKAFEFVCNPKNGCPAYWNGKPGHSHASWERYIRLSCKWKPLTN